VPEDSNGVLTPMAHEDEVRSGVLVRGTFEEDEPGTWDTRALG